jgi:YD repeat-containing protein
VLVVENATTNALERIVTSNGFDAFDHRNGLYEAAVDEGGLDLTTTWTLDGNGNVVEVSDPNEHITRLFYDGRDALVKVRDAEDYVTALDYDYRSRLSQVRSWFDVGSNGSAAESVTVDMEYDDLDRLIRQAVGRNVTGEPDIDVVSNGFAYEAVGGGGCSCSATPGAGLPHKLVDPNGKVTYLHYDKLNRIEKVVMKVGDVADNGGDSDDAVIQYFYDPAGNLIKVINAEDEEVEFAYDNAGRRTTVTVIVPGGSDLVTMLGYDKVGNVTSATLPNGNVISLAYDGAGRLVSGSDSLGLIVALTYDQNGNVLTRTDGNGNTWKFEYDAVDRLVKVFDSLRGLTEGFIAFD